MYGEIMHGDECPCADGLLTTNIECICNYEDVRHPYRTESLDYLYVLRKVSNDVFVECDKSFVRDSELFEDLEDI